VPELPEVETIVRDLRPRVAGRRLTTATLYHTDVLRDVSPARLLRALRGNRLESVDRRAKHVVMRLGSGERLVVQPRMTGTLIHHTRKITPTQRRYAVLKVGLQAGGWLVYRDVRRLGTVWLLDEAAWDAYTARIGPEPLDPAFGVSQFADCMRGTRQAIKKALMDQRRIAGIGNIYANEALFRAGISPSRQAGRLRPAEVEALHRSIRDILGDAVAARGTTVRDYRTGTGGAGTYQGGLAVYGRGDEPCVRCGAALKSTHALDGRATTYCRRCQGPVRLAPRRRR
jgi:formamidopyrimidine-DNA glycosylase